MVKYTIYDRKGFPLVEADTLPEIRKKGMAYMRKNKIPYMEVCKMSMTETDWVRDGKKHRLVDYVGTIQDWKDIRYADGSYPEHRGFTWFTSGKQPEKIINSDGTLGRRL